MINLNIDKDTCIKCGHCVRVCPASIFTQAKEGEEIGLQNIQSCILCGHCVGVCPTWSVIHSDFPPAKVHKIDKSLLPSPEQVITLIRSRRSNRAFSAKPVPRDLLEQIVEAGHRAPTASNAQEVEFTVITDPEKLRLVSSFTAHKLSSIGNLLDAPVVRFIIRTFIPKLQGYVPKLKKMEPELKKGNDLILRNVTALIFIHTPVFGNFASEDCNLAYQNASLMAESLGVTHFYTGYVMQAIKRDKRKKLTKSLGIEGAVYAGMALAMPGFRFLNYIDKKDIRVNWI